MKHPVNETDEQPRRILILKPSSLGDVVTAVPLLRALRRTYPAAHIAWLLRSDYMDLLRHDSDVSEVIPFRRRQLGKAWRSIPAAVELLHFLKMLRKGNFDWVLDLQGLLRSGLFAWFTRCPRRVGFAQPRDRRALWFYTERVETDAPHAIDRTLAFAHHLGLEASPADATLQISPAGKDFAAAFRTRHGLREKGYLACVPPTRWLTKIYPVHHWRALLPQLVRDWPVVLLGSHDPREMDLCRRIAEGMPAGVINATGQTDIAQMVGLVGASAGVIGSDSSAQYIGDALAVKVLSLVGPTRPERIRPYRHGRTLVANVPCQGCQKRSCSHITCMESIAPGEVLAAAKELFAG